LRRDRDRSRSRKRADESCGNCKGEVGDDDEEEEEEEEEEEVVKVEVDIDGELKARAAEMTAVLSPAATIPFSELNTRDSDAERGAKS
jgi:hypothetical protein